jgi:hemolysin activation/secretion protein
MARIPVLVATGTLALACAGALAQTPGGPQLERRDRPGVTEPLPGFQKPPTFVLPPVKPEAERPGLPARLRVFVRQVRVVGSTVFDEEQLRAVAAPFENTMQIVEGRLAGIRVTGQNRFVPSFITDRVELGAGPPLNVRELQETIQLLLQNPQIERVNAELAPGAQRGEAVLRMDVAEARRHTLGFSVANNRSPAVGQTRLELAGAVRNLLGRGDSLALRMGHTDGLNDQGFTYSVPITPRDTTFTLRYDRIASRVIEPPFNLINVQSKSEATELTLAHPIYRTLRSTLMLGGSMYYRSNATSLLGVPFSFTPGLSDGKANVAAARVFGDWLDRTQESVFAARVTYTMGLRVGPGTTSTANTPDSQYGAILAQTQWARRLGEDGRQIVLRADFQTASGELLPSEKFAIGGSETVRGYRENQIVRDNGWVASAEYRHPVGRARVEGLSEGENAGLVTAAVFVDAGRAWDHFGSDGRRFIWSYGPGIRWDIAEGVFGQVYWGFRQKSVTLPNNNIQDHGIHFRFGFAKAF